MTAVQVGSKFGVLDFRDDELSVKRFAEKNKEDGGWINAGFMVVEPEIFSYLTDDESLIFEQQPLRTLADEDKLAAYKHKGFWQCMDTQRDRNLLEALWRQGEAPWKVWQ